MVPDEVSAPQSDENLTKYNNSSSQLRCSRSQELMRQWFILYCRLPYFRAAGCHAFIIDGVQLMCHILFHLKIEHCVMCSLIEYIFEDPEKYKAEFRDFPSPSFLLKKSPDGSLVIYKLLDEMDCEWQKRRYTMVN